MTAVAARGRPAAVDPALLRRTMGGFATGVAVVTTSYRGEPHGMTVNSLTSVSLRPPLVLVCLTRGARTADAVSRRGLFALHLLSRRQEALSNRFARPGEDHFDGPGPPLDDLDLPILPTGIGRLQCEVDVAHAAGDHTIVVARVIGCEPRDGTPLVFYRGRYRDIHGQGHEAPWLW